MTTYLIKGAAVLGGEPTDLLLHDGVVAIGVRRRTPRAGARGRSTRPG